jgi:hypothetical protein
MSPSRTNRFEGERNANVRPGQFRRDLSGRRAIALELPEFLIYALEQRVAEANDGCLAGDAASLNDYIECELANLVTVRDVAELEVEAPGFSAAVASWVDGMRE